MRKGSTVQYIEYQSFCAAVPPLPFPWEMAVLGKHPDLLVGPPTATVFPTNDRKYKISQFFAKNLEKI
jgi:hypothetical protein